MKRKIIDAHIHLTQWESEDGKSIFDSLRTYQNDNGITALDNMCCTSNGDLWAGYEGDQTILGSVVKLENPSVFNHGCLFLPKGYRDYGEFSFINQVDEIMELGSDGIKICDFKPDAYKLLKVDKHLSEYERLIDYCEKYGVYMCWHIADPEPFWHREMLPDIAVREGWYYGEGGYPAYEKLNKMTYSLLDAHPKLKVVLAHVFFKSCEPDEVINLFDKYPNVSLDLAPGWEMFAGFKKHHGKWSEIFRKYSDRFMFATDMPHPSDRKSLNNAALAVLRFLQTDEEFSVPDGFSTKGVKLPDNELDNILFRNHEKALGETPREINKRALKKYIERYLPLLPDTRNKQLTEEYYRKNLI